MVKIVVSKIKIIHDCMECPYKKWRSVPHSSEFYCEISLEIITDITSIPSWCPLEDYKLGFIYPTNIKEVKK